MFTRLVKVGCSFSGCRAESVKYQTCLIFLRPLRTLVTHHNFIHLATGLSVNLRAIILPGLSVSPPGLSLSLPGLS